MNFPLEKDLDLIWCFFNFKISPATSWGGGVRIVI